MIRTRLIQTLRPFVASRPTLKKVLVEIDAGTKLLRHTGASVVPALIRPVPEQLTVAITARCNLRCIGCRYGRDFMPNAELPISVLGDLVTDAKDAGFPTVRFYGGEPLLHRELPTLVEMALQAGIKPYVTTNGLLLRQRMPDLYRAGLRTLTIGFYGVADRYDTYVVRDGAFSQLEASIAAVRDMYGMSVDLQINFLLTKQTCSIPVVRQAWAFAQRYHLSFNVDLVHYSLPYFTQGRDGELQFDESDGARLRDVSAELLRLKASAPALLSEPEESIRSIPDWAIKGSGMSVPCDAYKLLWIGADGTVQLCYAAFPLGNLHDTRLRDLFGTTEHRLACRQAFALQCPHCHCGRSSRIMSHLPSRIRYGRAS
jgi:MoaA/NifB/PqqE/SkfB family radical SAM enzyme